MSLTICFSVLVTVYHKDNPSYLQEALDSIMTQSLLPDEVVVVEDGPIGSNLTEVIKRFKQNTNFVVNILSLPVNVGTGLAINAGLDFCSYDLVAKMDSDDINYPYRFERQIALFKKNPAIDFCSAFVSEFYNDDVSKIKAYRKLPESHENIVMYAKKRCPLNQPVVMYRRSAVLDSGGYRKYTFGEDYDLWVRALLKGYNFYNIQEPLLYFRSNIDTIKKRGSLWYLKIDLAHHYDFYKLGFLSLSQFIYNSVVRIFVRLSPIKLRILIYNKLLRSKK